MSEWQSVEDFKKEANEGRCWIVYKDMVMLSFYPSERKTSPFSAGMNSSGGVAA